MHVFFEKAEVWSDVTIAGQTNKERESYSATRPWQVDMSTLWQSCNHEEKKLLIGPKHIFHWLHWCTPSLRTPLVLARVWITKVKPNWAHFNRRRYHLWPDQRFRGSKHLVWLVITQWMGSPFEKTELQFGLVSWSHIFEDIWREEEVSSQEMVVVNHRISLLIRDAVGNSWCPFLPSL